MIEHSALHQGIESSFRAAKELQEALPSPEEKDPKAHFTDWQREFDNWLERVETAIHETEAELQRAYDKWGDRQGHSAEEDQAALEYAKVEERLRGHKNNRRARIEKIMSDPDLIGPAMEVRKIRGSLLHPPKPTHGHESSQAA